MFVTQQQLAIVALMLGPCLALGGARASSTRTPTTVENRVDREVILMGTRARIQVSDAGREAALAASSRIVSILDEAESQLSTWSDETELAAFNAAPPGELYRLPAAISAELAEAIRCAEATRGAFDPTIGALVAAWDVRGRGRFPADREIQTAVSRVGVDKLTSTGASWTKTADVIVDEGGFGKGAALDRVAAWLGDSSIRRASVDLGGQVLMYQQHDASRDRPWTIGVVDPDDRSAIVAEVEMANGSVATASNSERGVGEGRIGHLLDPRSGRPAEDFGSVSVWAESALWADCLATGLFVAGPRSALAFADETEGVEVLVLERFGDGLKLAASAGLAGKVRLTDPSRTSFSIAEKKGNSHAQSSWILGERVAR